MARKKATEHKFRHPDLNTPMVRQRVSLIATDAEIQKAESQQSMETFRRFDLLCDELASNKKGGAMLMHLAWTLAFLYVPGLQTIDRRAGRGAPKRDGIESNPAALVALIDLTKDQMGLKSDRKACEALALSQNPELKSPRSKTALAKRVRSIANLLSAARSEAARTRH